MSQQPPGPGVPADPPPEATEPAAEAAEPTAHASEATEPPPWSPTVPLPQQSTTRMPQAPPGPADGWAQGGAEATWTGDQGVGAAASGGQPWSQGGFAAAGNQPTEPYQGTPTPAAGTPTPAPQGWQGSPGVPGAPSGAGMPGYPGAVPPGPPPGYQPPPPPGYQPGPPQPGPAAYQPGPPQPGPPAYQPGGTPWTPGGPTGPGGPGAGWPPGGSQGQKRGSKLPLVIGGGVAALALIVGGVVVVPKLLGGSNGPTNGPVVPTSTAPPAPKASDAVRAYLEALASGDAATAVGLLDAPGDRTLLTSEALKGNAGKGAISAITVTPDTSQDPSSVSAKYTVGTEATSYDFPVVKRGNVWKILKGTAKVTVRGASQGFVPVKINGVAVAATAPSELPAFPGVYAYASAAPALSLGPDVTATVLNPAAVKSPTTLPWALVDAGAVLNAAKASFTACVAAKSLTPPNCPFGLYLRTSQVISDPNTIVWKQRNDPWVGITPAVNQAEPLVVTLKIAPLMRSEARVTENGRTFNGFLDLTYESTAEVDLTSGTPTVTWVYTKK